MEISLSNGESNAYTIVNATVTNSADATDVQRPRSMRAPALLLPDPELLEEPPLTMLSPCAVLEESWLVLSLWPVLPTEELVVD